MATAYELLAGMEEIDKTLVIDNYLRVINIPSTIKTLGVEYDDEVLKLDFRMPRYVSDTDLSNFSISINYINSNGESDVYTVSKPAVYDQSIAFSWLVGPTATRYKGNTKFNVCLKTIDADGVIQKEFNTTIATLPVLEGLEVDERVVTNYTDIIEQWRQELFGIGDTEEANIRSVSQEEQAAIENKGAEVLATIPVDYATAVSMTDNADRTKADAIIRSTQNEVIRVDDSSDDYIRGLKIFGKTTQVSTTGKQLININQKIKSNSGITYTPNPDGSVHVKGTATANSYFICDSNNPVPVRETELIASISGSDQVYMNIGYFTSDGTVVNSIASVDNKTTKTFTYPTEAVTTRTFIGVRNGNTVDATVYPMVRLATVTDESYEPYTGGVASPSPNYPQDLVNIKNPTVNVYGKNLWPIEHIELNGSSGDDVMFEGRIPLPVAFSWVQDFTRTTGSAMFSYVVDGQTRFTASAETPGPFAHIIKNGQYLEKITLVNWAPETGNLTNIQLELGSTATEFEPFKPVQSIELPYSLPGIMLKNGNVYNRIDENGNKWICDEIDIERGVYIKRVNELVCKGTEGWVKSSTYPAYSLLLERQAATGLCTHMNRLSVTELREGWQGVYLEWSSYAIVQMQDYFPSLATFEAWLAEQYENGTPVVFRYAFEVPIEIPLTAEELDWFRFAHTNYPNTTIINNTNAPMELKYNADTKTYLNNCFRPTDDQVQNAVNAWLEAHYTKAEGVRF